MVGITANLLVEEKLQLSTMKNRVPVHLVRWQDKELCMYGLSELPTARKEEMLIQ
jgi:hypothetical protein